MAVSELYQRMGIVSCTYDVRELPLSSVPRYPSLTGPDGLTSILSQVPYPQVVLFGDSLFEASVEVQDGFSFFAAVQRREWLLSPRDDIDLREYER